MKLDKPKRALCIILGLCMTALFIILVWGKNAQTNQQTADESFTVTQRFYGVDAAEMERTAAIPLEDALSGIRGLRRIVSSSENGRTRVVCYFEGREQGRYEAVREAAQRVYESLPSAAQRPEITSSGDSRLPVWTAAVNGARSGPALEKAVKPALEGLPGVGTVEISGAGLKEIVITLKDKEAAARKIDAADIAAALAYNDVLLPGGSLRRDAVRYDADRSEEIPVMVDGRYTMEELRRALIPVEDSSGGRSFVRLEDIAVIAEQERNYDSRSRLDGKETALIVVMGSDGADLGKLSLRIKEELAKFPDLEFTILSDRGEAERQARSSVLGAALFGACMVAILCALICFRKRRFSVICSLTVPVSLFFSAAILILFGFSPDKLVLAGLSAGAGAAVDAAILCAEYFRSCKTFDDGKKALKALRFPIISGALTTVIALLPLMAQKSSGMNSVAWAVASVNFAAMVLALTLLPPLFLWGSGRSGLAAGRADRGADRLLDLKCDRVNAKTTAAKLVADLIRDRINAKSPAVARQLGDLKCDHVNPKPSTVARRVADLIRDRINAKLKNLKRDRVNAKTTAAELVAVGQPGDLIRDHVNAQPPKPVDLKRIRFKSAALAAAVVAPTVAATTIISALSRFYRRKLAGLMRLVLDKPLPVAGCWLLLSLLGIAALCLNGADVEQGGSEDTVYAQIEFDGGLYIEETDKLLAAYGAALKNHPGIINVQTVARTGTGSALVGFDPGMVNDKTVRELMRTTPVSGGFVYIVESSGNERSWRIKISGDEESRCRALAEEAARRCGAVPMVTETVLNFKEGSPRIDLKADRERIALNGLSFGSVGQTVRRAIHGPVAYKRIDGNGETDVRIRGRENPMSREEALEILVKGERDPFNLESLVSAESGREAASIQREDRRRSASISIRTAVMDPRRVRDRAMAVLADLELPPGYTVEFDREALKAAEGVSAQGFLFVLALLFCYMVIAALKESFTFPLALLAAAPPSLAVPAFCLVLWNYPLSAVTAAAFVAVSGLAVSAAAIVADALQRARPDVASYYSVFRRRLPVLAATTLTTVAGAVPFLFIKSGAALVVKTLSLVSALGVAVSAVCAVTLIPALIKIFPRLLMPYNSEDCISSFENSASN